MAITISDLQTSITAAKAALAAGSWQSAKALAAAAYLDLVSLPNTTIGSRRVEYRNMQFDLEMLIKTIDKLELGSNNARKNRRVFAAYTRA